jgi:hypothetical protein
VEAVLDDSANTMRCRKDPTQSEKKSKMGRPGKNAQYVEDIRLMIFIVPGGLKVVEDEESRLGIIFKCNGKIA